MIDQTTVVKIGRRTYEKICTCINGIYTNLCTTYIKTKWIVFKEPKYPNTYTQEMEFNTNHIKYIRTINLQAKQIRHERMFNYYYKEKERLIEFIIFVCKELNNYKPVDQVQNKLTEILK